MNKEEILETIKKENKKVDYYTIEVEAKACKIASLCMVFLAFIYFTFEIATGKGSNPAFYSMITMFNAILYGYKAIKLVDCRKTNYVSAIIWTLLTIMLILTYFKVI